MADLYSEALSRDILFLGVGENQNKWNLAKMKTNKQKCSFLVESLRALTYILATKWQLKQAVKATLTY